MFCILLLTSSWNFTSLSLGLLRQPKWGHLRDLHKAIKLCEPALVSGFPVVTSLGNKQEVNFYQLMSIMQCGCCKWFKTDSLFCVQSHVFWSDSGDCAAFLANYDTEYFVKVAFNGMHYDLPPWSISILPDCKTTVFNTARVRKTCNCWTHKFSNLYLIQNFYIILYLKKVCAIHPVYIYTQLDRSFKYFSSLCCGLHKLVHNR